MKTIRKLFNKTICLNNKTCVVCLLAILISTVVFASNIFKKEEIVISKIEEQWVPTKEDIAYQDSMYAIILTTQQDVKIMKKDILKILNQLETK